MTQKSRMALPRMHGVSMNACIARSFLFLVTSIAVMLVRPAHYQIARAQSQAVPTISDGEWTCSYRAVETQVGYGVVRNDSWSATYVFESNGIVRVVTEPGDREGHRNPDELWVQTGSQVRWNTRSASYRASLDGPNSMNGVFETSPDIFSWKGTFQCTRSGGGADSTKSKEPSPSDEALKQMRDPFGRKQQASGKTESGLADPFKKDESTKDKSGKVNAAALALNGQRAAKLAQEAKDIQAAKILDLTKSTWSPTEASFDPRNPYPTVFNLIAPNGGLVLAMDISIGQVTIGGNFTVATGTLTVDVVNDSTCTLHLSGMLYSKGTPIKDLGDKNIGPGNRIAAHGPSGAFSADANSRLVFRPSGFLHDCQ